MDVFGMGMRIVAFILFQKLTSSFGERKLNETKNVIYMKGFNSV